MIDDGTFPETARDLRALLTARGLKPTRRHGQHFLIEPRLLDVIARLGELGPGDVVLEVGTGPGTLTRRLAEVVRLVVSVEIDSGLFSLARDLLGSRPTVRVVHADILATKSSLDPEVLEKLDVALVDPETTGFKVVSNLPYNVTTPFLAALLARFGAPDLMVLLVQKEAADNMVSGPGTKAYGPLAIALSLLAEVRIARKVGPEAFWPRPRVESAIVTARSRSGADGAAVTRAFPLTRFLFSERRKTLRALLDKLPAEMGGPLDAAARARVLEEVGLSGGERAEALAPEVFLALDRAVSNHAGRG